MQIQTTTFETSSGVNAFGLARRPALAPESEASKRGVVLVADDDQDILELFRLLLEEGGYKVITASNGKIALSLAAQHAFDAAIIDLVMPEQDGIESIQLLRRKHPHVKIVAVSGAFEGDFLAVAKSLGASAALMKPLRQSTLLHIMNNLLSKPA